MQIRSLFLHPDGNISGNNPGPKPNRPNKRRVNNLANDLARDPRINHRPQLVTKNIETIASRHNLKPVYFSPIKPEQQRSWPLIIIADQHYDNAQRYEDKRVPNNVMRARQAKFMCDFFRKTNHPMAMVSEGCIVADVDPQESKKTRSIKFTELAMTHNADMITKLKQPRIESRAYENPEILVQTIAVTLMLDDLILETSNDAAEKFEAASSREYLQDLLIDLISQLPEDTARRVIDRSNQMIKNFLGSEQSDLLRTGLIKFREIFTADNMPGLLTIDIKADHSVFFRGYDDNRSITDFGEILKHYLIAKSSELAEQREKHIIRSLQRDRINLMVVGLGHVTNLVEQAELNGIEVVVLNPDEQNSDLNNGLATLANREAREEYLEDRQFQILTVPILMAQLYQDGLKTKRQLSI